MPTMAPNAFLVAIDFKATMVDRKPLIDELQRSDTWWHWLSNVWLIVRHQDLAELQRVLTPLIYDQDSLLILPAIGPVGGFLPKAAWDWIGAHVPNAHAWAPPQIPPPPKAFDINGLLASLGVQGPKQP